MLPTKNLPDCIQNDRRFPIRSRDGTCIRILLANRCEQPPSNRKASGFLGLLDVIESDLGGYTAACGSIEAKVLVLPAHARVVELAYTADLKSATVKVCGFKSHL